MHYDNGGNREKVLKHSITTLFLIKKYKISPYVLPLISLTAIEMDRPKR
jgi:hypothetical protein